MEAGKLHPNAQRLLQMVQAWNTGDAETIINSFDEDPTLHVAGQNSVSGTYRGQDEVGRITHRLLSMIDNAVKIDPLDILADDEHVVLLHHMHGERGRKSLDVRMAVATEFGPNGKLRRMWFLTDDQRSYDEFFG